jgi:diamine N-acetyltransferase
MVDARYQGREYGQRAVGLRCEYVRTRRGANELLASHILGVAGPGRLYQKPGFTYTGDEEDGELDMRLGL